MARKPILAAGGIVVRSGARPLVAVVQRSKDERWVLPRGKLDRNEDPAAGARREAVEETGHRVDVHEFLGAITYRASGRPKVVQFWRMHAAARPSRDVMKDILAVEWLPLSAAVRRLTYPLEKLFLQHVGRNVLKRHRRKAASRKAARRKLARRKAARKAARKPAKPRHHRRPARKKTVVRRNTQQRSGKVRAAKTHIVKTATHQPRPSMLRRMLGRLAR
jgi:8-oxo-dGTP diphosphatase